MLKVKVRSLADMLLLCLRLLYTAADVISVIASSSIVELISAI